jgi:protein SCO1/2
MKTNFAKHLLYNAAAGAVLALMLCTFAAAQKAEHYNSPLYSPKYYDPSQQTSNGMPEPLKKVGIEQRLGEKLPLEAVFKDENGREVKLGEYFSKGRPIVLALVYYECPMLCNQVLNGLTGSMKGINLDAGKDFDVVAISFDASENDKPELGKTKKAGYLERYGRPGTDNGFHFLTGTQASIDAVTNAVGFTYEWDDKSNQFAHASGVMIANPDGKLSRYLYGIDYSPKDLKFGIMESAENKVGSITDQLLLYCYHYDPSSGKYGFAILSALRLAGIATLLGMGLMGFVFWRRTKNKAVTE